MSKVLHIVHQNPHFRVRECSGDIKNTIGWMVYKIVYGSFNQLFQTWKNGSFMNASQHTGYFAGSNHEYTLSEPLQWFIVLPGFTWIPFLQWNMLYHRPQDSLTPGKLFHCECQCTISISSFLLDHHTAVAHDADWLHLPLNTFPPWKRFYHGSQGFWYLENQYCHEYQSPFWLFPLDQTMTTHLGPTSWCFCSQFTTW